MPWKELSVYLAKSIRALADDGFCGPLTVADGRIIHNAGGSEAQELAFALAAAIDVLRALKKASLALDAARKLIYFRLAADADEFLTIAKFRAIRKLWARVEAACDLTPEPVIIHAEIAWRMMTKRDPYVNMLRATIAVTAAGVGGADAISVLPHTAALGLPDAFARRIARNIQLVLLEESNLDKTADPAAGSGAIEHLTDEMCAAAWSKFQVIDAAGGAWTALEKGLIQNEVGKVRAAREAAVAKRKDAITGTSDYPDLHEQHSSVLATAPAPNKNAGSPPAVEPLPSIRLAEPFEALRDRSDAALAKGGARPKVFLATLGKTPDFTARATFAKNFYEAGGIEAISSEGYASADDMVAAFRASGAKLACLCSTDKVYETQAAGAAKALKSAGAVVHLAGRPGDHESAWRQAGVETFVYVGCDALATLRAAHDILAVR
jgi:methylmalonyl-CoA mutase